MKIKDVKARQILDSRGFPTVEAKVILEDGTIGVGSAPSGASTGSHEAHELRDGGEAFGGKGVLRAVENVNSFIRNAIIGLDCSNQAQIDKTMNELDDSGNKAHIGGNAMIAVSWAAADAAAKHYKIPLYRYLGGIQAKQMPCPMMNVINGGRHAGNNLDIQEFMFVPLGAGSFQEAVRMGAECYHALKDLLKEAGLSTAVGDEGGFAPDIESDAAALEFMVRAIEKAGWKPGEDVCLAVDAAASEWMEGDHYLQPKSGKIFRKGELINYFCGLMERFPLVSIEDPLGEDDFDGFRDITQLAGARAMIVGDDLFTTNEARLMRGIEAGAANAILIKPNQIGTVSETLDTINLARKNGYNVIISHRSGETESTHIADLAVAVNAEFIKSGAPARSERLAKYNRLMEIEDMLQG